jgi:hypothetical protein
MEEGLPRERVVYLAYKLIVTDCLSTQWWCEVHREFLEMCQMLTKVGFRDVIKDIEQGHCCAGVVDSLICEPHIWRTT